MNVVVLTHLFPSETSPGLGSFVEEQCRALAAHVDITVVAGRWGQASRTEEIVGGIRVIGVPLEAPMRRPSAARIASVVPRYTRAALAAVRELDRPPDVIHSHFALPDGVTALRVARMMGVPIVITLHGSDYNRQMSVPVAGGLLARTIGGADSIIAVSRQIAEGFAATVPGAADRVEFVPNGYDSAIFHFEPKEAAGGFLFVGSLSPVKNPLLLVEAYSRIAGTTTRNLTMIGEGPLRDEIEQAIQARDLSDRVHLLGRVSHDALQPHFRSAHALVLPSRSEGMPLVVIEGLATGTPIVASRVGAIPDLVSDGASGLLVAPGDAAGLADALRRADGMSWDNAAIAEGAPIIDWNENARRVNSIYARLAERRL